MKDLVPKPLVAKYNTVAAQPEKVREKVAISPKRIVFFLLTFAFSLLAINITLFILVAQFGAQHPILEKILYKFDLNTEFNIPTLFSCSLYVFASVLLYFVSRLKSERKKGNKWFWKSLSWLFIFLTLDEALEIHEKFDYLNKYFGVKAPTTSMHDPWIIFYFLFAIAIGALFVKFLLSLPRKTRNLFMISAVSLSVAAMGFEIPESYIFYHYGVNAAYRAFYCLEEVMEMCSVILFIYALLDYLCVYNAVRITYEPPAAKSKMAVQS
jgi:hypothetical protein